MIRVSNRHSSAGVLVSACSSTWRAALDQKSGSVDRVSKGSMIPRDWRKRSQKPYQVSTKPPGATSRCRRSARGPVEAQEQRVAATLDALVEEVACDQSLAVAGGC